MRPAHQLAAATLLGGGAGAFGGLPLHGAGAAGRVPFAKEAHPEDRTPTAIWVELTGRPSQLARITVSAADSDTQ